MKKYYYTPVFLFCIFSVLISGCHIQKKNLKYTLPHLPYPIAKERALITVAGQGPEGLIVSQMCDQLKIAHTYNYKGKISDLEGKRSLIVVIGVSKLGMQSVATNFFAEKQRILTLVNKAKEQRMPVIMLYLGKSNRWDKQNKEMLALVGEKSNYMIAISDEYSESFFRKLAEKNKIKFTLVKDIQRVKIPLNSVFR